MISVEEKVFSFFKIKFSIFLKIFLSHLVMRVEDDDGDLTITQHTQLVSFLHQTKLSLGECNLSVPLVRDACDVDFLATHVECVTVSGTM